MAVQIDDLPCYDRIPFYLCFMRGNRENNYQNKPDTVWRIVCNIDYCDDMRIRNYFANDVNNENALAEG